MIVPVSTDPRPVRGPGPRYRFYVQVLTPGVTVRIGSSHRELSDPNDGLRVTATDGIRGFWWYEELWIVADADAQVVVEWG